MKSILPSYSDKFARRNIISFPRGGWMSKKNSDFVYQFVKFPKWTSSKTTLFGYWIIQKCRPNETIDMKKTINISAFPSLTRWLVICFAKKKKKCILKINVLRTLTNWRNHYSHNWLIFLLQQIFTHCKKLKAITMLHFT